MNDFKIAKCQHLRNLGSGSLELVISASQSTEGEAPGSSISTLLQTDTSVYTTKTTALANCYKNV